jgi:hypothetical protein
MPVSEGYWIGVALVALIPALVPAVHRSLPVPCLYFLPLWDCPAAAEWKTIRMRIGLDLEESRRALLVGAESSGYRLLQNTHTHRFSLWNGAVANCQMLFRSTVSGFQNVWSGRGPDSSPEQVMWDLWWTKWHWGRFSPSTSFSPTNNSSDYSQP